MIETDIQAARKRWVAGEARGIYMTHTVGVEQLGLKCEDQGPRYLSGSLHVACFIWRAGARPRERCMCILRVTRRQASGGRRTSSVCLLPARPAPRSPPDSYTYHIRLDPLVECYK